MTTKWSGHLQSLCGRRCHRHRESNIRRIFAALCRRKVAPCRRELRVQDEFPQLSSRLVPVMLNVRLCRKITGPRGHALTQAAAVLVLTCLAAAWAVDSSYHRLTGEELLQAAERAALAAVRVLPGEAVFSEREVTAALRQPGIAPPREQAASPAIQLGVWNGSSGNVLAIADAPSAVMIELSQEPARDLISSWLNREQKSRLARATATVLPRDIVFVVDVSGSMNDLTQQAAQQLAAAGTGDSPDLEDARALLEPLFSQFGYGEFPGPSEPLGATLSLGQEATWEDLLAVPGPLAGAEIPPPWRLLPEDSSTTRHQKVGAWIAATQIARLLPNALPPAQNAQHAHYWLSYIDFLLRQPVAQVSPADAASGTILDAPARAISYVTYLQFMLEHGRERSPDLLPWQGQCRPTAGTKTPLSRSSEHVPRMVEQVDQRAIEFLPAEQPLHAVRRALLGALEELSLAESPLHPLAQDRVALIAYDGLDAEHAPELVVPLSTDSPTLTMAIAELQSAGDAHRFSATEAALQLAREHLAGNSRQTQRQVSQQLIILITACGPLVRSATTAEINGYLLQQPQLDKFPVERVEENALLRQASLARAENLQLFVAGVGLHNDRELLYRLARAAGTADRLLVLPSQTEPREAEQHLAHFLRAILHPREVRVVAKSLLER